MLRYIQQEMWQHCRSHRQMLFLSGPRQVGKTTVAKRLVESFANGVYLNWDDQSHRELILQGPRAVAATSGLDHLRTEPAILVFDELHKYRQWRDFLKGLFDQYEDRSRTLVTGSASLDTFKRGGDSLMGRYFPYTLHPLSVAECVRESGPPAEEINPEPRPIDAARWEALWKFGGFPEPFLKAEQRFYNRWRKLRTEQLLREDLRDLTRIQELDQVETLAAILRAQVGQLTSYSSMARQVRVSVDTIRRWISTLESLYFCFSLRPWHSNVARGLRKEPKYYLWDWSQVGDPGARAENLVASALLKAVHWWNDSGQGEFGLHFIRDKQKREVDFVVTREQQPWFLAEVKSSGRAGLSPALKYFQGQTRARHAFQVALDLEFVERDCFETNTPTVVPAKTFLSQLV